MERHFDQDLNRLKETLLTMGSHAEKAVSQSVKSLMDRDDSLARQVKEDDTVLDHYEVEVDEMAIRLLALQGPVASDLRLIAVCLKVTRDLERVGDEATTIARRALELNKEPQLKSYLDIPRMANQALAMLREALDSFVQRDVPKAQSVLGKDKEVDSLNHQVHRELVGYMLENPGNITRCLNLMVISKSLERIADHATNIAEEVVYLYEGRDIRHTGKGKK